MEIVQFDENLTYTNINLLNQIKVSSFRECARMSASSSWPHLYSIIYFLVPITSNLHKKFERYLLEKHYIRNYKAWFKENLNENCLSTTKYHPQKIILLTLKINNTTFAFNMKYF